MQRYFKCIISSKQKNSISTNAQGDVNQLLQNLMKLNDFLNCSWLANLSIHCISTSSQSNNTRKKEKWFSSTKELPLSRMRKRRKPVKSPLLKKKRTSSESTFIRSLVDDPDNLPVMVARPPGQSDVIKTRKFHGHRLPSATNRTRDVSFYDPWYPCTSIMQIRMKVTKRCSWRICIYIYSRGEKWRQARSFPRGSKSSLWRAIECMYVVYVCTYLVYRVNR